MASSIAVNKPTTKKEIPLAQYQLIEEWAPQDLAAYSCSARDSSNAQQNRVKAHQTIPKPAQHLNSPRQTKNRSSSLMKEWMEPKTPVKTGSSENYIFVAAAPSEKEISAMKEWTEPISPVKEDAPVSNNTSVAAASGGKEVSVNGSLKPHTQTAGTQLAAGGKSGQRNGVAHTSTPGTQNTTASSHGKEITHDRRQEVRNGVASAHSTGTQLSAVGENEQRNGVTHASSSGTQDTTAGSNGKETTHGRRQEARNGVTSANSTDTQPPSSQPGVVGKSEQRNGMVHASLSNTYNTTASSNGKEETAHGQRQEVHNGVASASSNGTQVVGSQRGKSESNNHQRNGVAPASPTCTQVIWSQRGKNEKNSNHQRNEGRTRGKRASSAGMGATDNQQGKDGKVKPVGSVTSHVSSIPAPAGQNGLALANATSLNAASSNDQDVANKNHRNENQGENNASSSAGVQINDHHGRDNEGNINPRKSTTKTKPAMPSDKAIVYTTPNGTTFNRYDLAKASLGVMTPKGKVFFRPNFIVDDPWAGMKPVLTECLRRW